MNTQITFKRQDCAFLDQFAVITIEHAQNEAPKHILAAFCRGVTKWVEKTSTGKKAWEDSSEDLNIGDLIASHEGDPELAKYLKLQGITSWECTYWLSDRNVFDYDLVLADPEEIDEPVSTYPYISFFTLGEHIAHSMDTEEMLRRRAGTEEDRADVEQFIKQDSVGNHLRLTTGEHMVQVAPRK
jgi:hypothetical protein